MPNCSVCDKKLTAFNRAYGSGSGKCTECATGESSAAILQAAYAELDKFPELREEDIRDKRVISGLLGLSIGGLFVFGATYLAGRLAPGVGSALGCLVAVWIVGLMYSDINPLESGRWTRFWHGSVLGYYGSVLAFWLLWRNTYIPFNSTFVLDALVGIAFGFLNVCVNDRNDKDTLVDLHSAWRLSLEEKGIPIEQRAIFGGNSIEYEVPIYKFAPTINSLLFTMVSNKADALQILPPASPGLDFSGELRFVDFHPISETQLIGVLEALAPKQIRIPDNRLSVPSSFLFAVANPNISEQAPNRYVLFHAEASRNEEGRILARFSLGIPEDNSDKVERPQNESTSKDASALAPVGQTAAATPKASPLPDIQPLAKTTNSPTGTQSVPELNQAVSVKQRLSQLKELRANELIDSDEYALKKSKILDEI